MYGLVVNVKVEWSYITLQHKNVAFYPWNILSYGEINELKIK